MSDIYRQTSWAGVTEFIAVVQVTNVNSALINTILFYLFELVRLKLY